MKRLTIYETLEYENLLKCYEWYENRSDLMKSITRDFKINEVIEEFHKGRADSLKTFIHFPKEMKKGFFKFYSKSRFDCLKDISYDSTHVTEFYENRRDL